VANGQGGASLPLLKGTLDLLVLKTLSWTEMHGFGISSWLERQSDGTLAVDDSALYQSLHRLEERGLVSARWGLTENNRRARWYRLTSAGRKHLVAESEAWTRYARSVGSILALSARPA
jgi:PadR family transcriptional regulator, regulatory protein PadR